MTYHIRITEASGDVVSVDRIEATNAADAERRQATHWNDNYGHTADRYKSELIENDEVVMTIGGWEEDEDD